MGAGDGALQKVTRGLSQCLVCRSLRRRTMRKGVAVPEMAMLAKRLHTVGASKRFGGKTL
jgi:hypothetical protein